MIRFISFVGTLTETRIGVGMVTFPSKGPMWDKYVFFMAKSQSFSYVLHFQLLFLEILCPISLKSLCIFDWNVSWLKQEWGLVG